VVTPHPEHTPDEVADLLGAYALDACTPDETAAIEAVLSDHPDLAEEAMRLRRAASWIGATETLVPPASLRDRVYAFALTQRMPGRPEARVDAPVDVLADGPLDTYLSLSGTMAAVIEDLPESALDDTTANGLTARDLVVHMAAQESLLAQVVGVPVLPELAETDIDARTAALLPSFRDRSVAAAAELWQRSVATNRTWALDNVGGNVTWRGIPMSRDDAIVIRAFETWIHTDDLRRVAGWDLVPPAAGELSVMSELASRILPIALSLRDAEHPGKTARLVLTGDGGGDWLVALGADGPDGGSGPDVTLTAEVVDWCRLVGDRVSPSELVYAFDGDGELARDLVAAAPALATL
jgi:uncharacterized protein (TIGR03083 family)